MKPKIEFLILAFAAFLALGLGSTAPAQVVVNAPEVPIPGMVTMVDLGADKCVPCKMMAPILIEVRKEYAGKAAVVFLDVWKDPTPARKFGIRVIPTQIFFDDKGKEFLRHEGFMDKATIVEIFAKLGVKK